ncbi:Predicted DNA-binding protein, contains XRE-type HTH domain [Modicisalibacter muralis]|uniref:Predicted DNA-binding protein, contains XRE-type HTH domain n=1 Tax=Modicisalibacter muralis TaxID=119000 RepID=A0A1G9IB11_9GAMM|nr:helix-turn-helix transcriptional regulator [Halomonas muralis]SDL22399.1 Predicted DNA-binding protein, contains XRE-type HTH domain [Halomonas muralis]
MIEIEQGSTNVYADIGFPDADEMFIKAQLVTKIGDIIKQRRLTQTQASVIMGIAQSRLSDLLRGRFRDISEGEILEYLAHLER